MEITTGDTAPINSRYCFCTGVELNSQNPCCVTHNQLTADPETYNACAFFSHLHSYVQHTQIQAQTFASF